ncbi:RES family NAD+ phosphorylase [Gramella sp. AN32]|uniref:RES family NAD+ phosphorylase n=1 Tax=Christiangramia antarctica TaxID=2058158 RepID=A0ABW5X459_9FLAO|nr:RES family NAD+ phosphorylase [Gramella sp. AN32]MCM4157698.1 RES domain-containing protein [Gramella sp. AN32]
MEVFRIARKEHSTKLTSSGAPNRWNKIGQHVIYAGTSRSLSSLELCVHLNSIHLHRDYRMMIISIADEDQLIDEVRLKDLPENWKKIEAYSYLQNIGSNWYEKQGSLILKVPSVIIQQENNYLINLRHPHFNRNVRLVRSEPYFWDERLF